MSGDISYTKAGYRADKWKWVLKLPDWSALYEDSDKIDEFVKKVNMLQTYGLDKPPKILPCLKKCSTNPWCLTDIIVEVKNSRAPLTEKPRLPGYPVGLQNTSNTCRINSALQALFHIAQFRNVINSISHTNGEDSLGNLAYLLQATFIEMDMHSSMALACNSGNMFEKLAVFATQTIMQKDQDFEVLKCVSEFLENSIDTLLVDPISGSRFSPLFRSSLLRVAKWRCTNCRVEHTHQLPPDTCYTMAAYVSADECPLNQCILDLQTETQTGVSLTCEGNQGGCGATVKVDRVVTPKVLSLPSLLIIRNNSLVDRVAKRRQHVVYPETLELGAHTYNQETATYSLRAVIFHHGYWVKHFSAHVKTESGSWYNFNDEKVTRLANQTGMSIPLEHHRNYFSLANIASKYKHRSHVRVSRGAFIWIYERRHCGQEIAITPPQQNILNFVTANTSVEETKDTEALNQIKNERKELFKDLAVQNLNEDVVLISKAVLSSWLYSDDLNFVPPPSILETNLCEHRKFNPRQSIELKCIRKSEFPSLLLQAAGIHSEEKLLPVGLHLEEAFCRVCVSKHAHHILFREHIKELFKRAKKESQKSSERNYSFIGTTSLSLWPKVALRIYLKNNSLEEDSVIEVTEPDVVKPGSESEQEILDPEELEDHLMELDHTVSETNSDLVDADNFSVPRDVAEKPVSDIGKFEANIEKVKITDSFSESGSQVDSELDRDKKDSCSDIVKKETQEFLFNQDLLCPHNLQDPKANACWIPDETMEQILDLCRELQHPAILDSEYGLCKDCQNVYDMSHEVCEKGKIERKRLYQVFLERRRPNLSKDEGKKVFILCRNFFAVWKSFVKLCERNDLEAVPPSSLNNCRFICKHGELAYSGVMLSSPEASDFLILLTEEEWNILMESYTCDYRIEATIMDTGLLETVLQTCEKGCVEERATQIYEEQFNYDYGLINLRQVNSSLDIPSNTTTVVDSSEEPRKKRRVLPGGEGLKSPIRTNQRLTRASKNFASTDTIREVQNFIAERTGIWPMLQTLWLTNSIEHGSEPFCLSDNHRSMTLTSLKIKPDDTIYFMANPEDLEKITGDGVIEFMDED